jgi:hypothetical protein
VSNTGGNQPRWRGDGKELFYLSTDNKMMAVLVKTGSNFDAGTPTALFQANPREMFATSELLSYDVRPCVSKTAEALGSDAIFIAPKHVRQDPARRFHSALRAAESELSGGYQRPA